MAFHFKSKESAATGVKRLCRELSEESISALKNNSRAPTVHRVRKDVKKIRAVLRLARESVPKKVRRRQMKLLREATGILAPVRDAHVAINSLKSLNDGLTNGRGKNPFPRTARGLGRRLRDALRDFAEKHGSRKTRKRLRRFQRTLDDCRFRCKGWDALGPGVNSCYHKARASYHGALANPLPAQLHEWRKRAKDVWYCLQLLHASGPRQIEPLADAFGRLGDALGNDHDLWMLRRTARRVAKDAPKELSTLAELIALRRRKLQKTAFDLGARLFAETPASFHKKLAQLWKAWRKGEKRGRGK